MRSLSERDDNRTVAVRPAARRSPAVARVEAGELDAPEVVRGIRRQVDRLGARAGRVRQLQVTPFVVDDEDLDDIPTGTER